VRQTGKGVSGGGHAEEREEGGSKRAIACHIIYYHCHNVYNTTFTYARKTSDVDGGSGSSNVVEVLHV